MKINLECIDASLRIDVENINIQIENVKKITRAWADGHTVVVSFNRWYGSEVKIEIKSVNNATQVAWWENDITKEWLRISRILLQQQLPAEWLQVIDEIRRVNGHVSIYGVI